MSRIIVSLLLVGLILTVPVGCKRRRPSKTKSSAASAAPAKPGNQPRPQNPQPQPQSKPQQASRPSMADDVSGVINYGIGATQLNAKRKMESKLKNIQGNHNERTNRALNE